MALSSTAARRALPWRLVPAADGAAAVATAVSRRFWRRKNETCHCGCQAQVQIYVELRCRMIPCYSFLCFRSPAFPCDLVPLFLFATTSVDVPNTSFL